MVSASDVVSAVKVGEWRALRAQVPATGEALPRARARYAVAPVLLATYIFYTPHIKHIVVMFCYDAKSRLVLTL